MKQVGDYIRFAVGFTGVGYIILWPLAVGGNGLPFGGSFICGLGALAVFCHFPHPLTLPPALHVLGALSAVAVTGRYACRLGRRLRRRAGSARTVPELRLSAAIGRMSGPPTLRAPRRIRPRREFGLRRPPQ